MAETVKKSRIVSDETEEDLEEALMEEFNMRLKNCMSQDNLQANETEADELELERAESPTYSNIEIIKSNNISRDFIKIEKENYYEDPYLLNHKKKEDEDYDEPCKTVVVVEGCQGNNVEEKEQTELGEDEQQINYNNQNGHENYENIVLSFNNDKQMNKTDTNEKTVNLDQYVDMRRQNPPVQILLGNSFTNNNGDVINEPEYEDIEDNHVIINNHPELKIDSCDKDNTSSEKSADAAAAAAAAEIKSVKDRMLLSTDTQPCLFFTQTVTSPMLTPSEENIDFLKGFRQAIEDEKQQPEDTTSSPPTSDPIILTQDKDETDDLLGNQEVLLDENIYENSAFIKETQAIYENLKEIKTQSENIYENVTDLINNEEKQYDQVLTDESKSEEVLSEIENDEDIKTTTTTATMNSINNEVCVVGEIIKKKDQCTATTMVENLKTQFTQQITSSSVEVTSSSNLVTKKELDGTLKSVDIMRHINKFEQNEQKDESTQVTEYVETTTFQSNSGTEKGIKKKKTKKSRKEEKENISVNGTNNTNNNNNSINNAEESFYNVNVKSLCRSFGDLTKVEENTAHIINNYDNRTRTKSMSDNISCAGRTTTSTTTYNNNKLEKVFSGVSVKLLKSSFNKFDALQKKNVLHVRSSDSTKAQEKFNGQSQDSSNCRACDKAVFQMEQIKAEKSIWHRNCFRCKECNKQLNVDTYESHEGHLYCKPHFKALFAPKAVEDEAPPKSRKPELIIRENQPLELPPDVVRASDKPDLGLEELQSLNVKERFQVFEHHQQQETNEIERGAINVKRSPSILSKLARFQAKGMDIGVADESLNGIPIEESSSEAEEEEEDGMNGEDADLVRAKRVQKEKPFHFTGMSDVKSKWEQGEQITSRDERREERKQEIQSIRNRLFMGKQGKMKEAYQQAVMESESCTNLKREQPTEVFDTKSLKEKFEKGELVRDHADRQQDSEETEVYESEISKKSRSLFLELDANASKAPQITPIQTPKIDIKRAREAYISKAASGDTIKSVDQVDDVPVRTADIQERFKFFETYREPEKERKAFRITPPREGQVKVPTPEREVYRDPEIVRCEEIVEDSVVAKQSHTATKMLNKFRQMEENLTKQDAPSGPKPLKCFTPPPEPARLESNSDDDESGSEEEEDEDGSDVEEHGKVPDGDLLEAQKAARAKQLRAKFERWEANEIKREQNNGAVNIAEELGEDQSQIESTRTLRARFESMRETNTESNRQPRVKVNRFVEVPAVIEMCESCQSRVYPLERISVHKRIYHKGCFKCMECNCVLRMDSYSYNQGLFYCMHHFKRLFKEKGNYDTGFGLGQHKGKWHAKTA